MGVEKKLKRKYTHPIIKKLFALSGNQCARPDCSNPIIEQETEHSDAAVVGQICHIYAISEDGPRGKAGLTEDELNSLENLILCCGHHHPVIDKQHETYTADLLKQWKSAHEAKIRRLVSQGSRPIHSELFDHKVYPKDLVDQRLEESAEQLRKARFFPSFDRIGSAERLAKDTINGIFFGASDAQRCRALAWCARILSVTDKADNAEELLDVAKVLGVRVEIGIAEAFIASRNEDKKAALKILGAALDCRETRSASLMIIATEDGIEAGVKWLQDAQIMPGDLDSDGKFFLLHNLLADSKWDSAISCLQYIKEEDCRSTPILLRTIALTHLVSAINIELRPLVLGQIPFEARRFPLSSTPDGLESLSQARIYFSAAAAAERELGFTDAASFCEDYVLWLELRDQELSDQAFKRLEADLRDSARGLRLVALGLEFGIKVNKEAVEKEIARQTALKGEITFDAAIARFALCFVADSEAEAARALEDHKSILIKHIDILHILRIQTEMYARSGQLEKAKECLSELKERGLDDDELRRIGRFIDAAQGGDKIAILIQEYGRSCHINDLDNLTEELAKQERYEELVGYAKEYFDKTPSLLAASRYLTALFNSHDYSSVVSFIKENEFFLEQSDYLRLLYSWALYHEGLLIDAGEELKKIGKDYNEAEVRLLTINLAISSGNWNAITVTLAHEYEKIGERTGEELIQLAKLSYQIASPYAKDFLSSAAEKGVDSAQVMANAYFIATEQGIENTESVSSWLNRAIELSGHNGPMRMTSLQEVLDLKPGWDSRSADVWEKIARAEAPLFVAGEVLNRTLIELMLFPAIANQEKRDVRERALIPAYSGKRPIQKIDGVNTVGFDPAALLTVSFLGMIDKVLNSFEKVYIPHATLGWLFTEKQKASFHQPSKIKDAHQIRHLVSEVDLSILEPRQSANSDLTATVGEELSQLLTEARNLSSENEEPVFVVRSSPVRQVGSYTDNEADLSGYSDLLSGCQPIIEKLFVYGQISESEKGNMTVYLLRQEVPWPHQPDIPAGATLMLDGLSVTYFQHLGVLGKLKRAGFKVYISKNEITEANSLIWFENASATVRDVIEGLRSALNRGIGTGQVLLGKKNVSDKEVEGSYYNHPSYGAISLADICDAVVFDDRYINKNANVQGREKTVKALTTLDLLHGLTGKAVISDRELNGYKSTLRKAGYIFVDLKEDELFSYIAASAVRGGSVVETLELKGVRESILRVRMSNWLALPDEAPWIIEHFKLFGNVMKTMWREFADKDIEATKVKAGWLLELLDIRGWAHSLPGDQVDQIGNTGRLNHVMLIVALPPELTENIRSEYWAWLDEKIVIPIKEQYPDLYLLLLESQKAYIDHVVNSDLPGAEKPSQSSYMKAALFEAAMELLSPTISNSLCRDDEFRKQYTVTETAQLNIGGTGLLVDRAQFLSGIREILSGKERAECHDSDGEVLLFLKHKENQDIIRLVIGKGEREIALPGFFQFSPDLKVRISGFQKLAGEVNLPAGERSKWMALLEERALHDEEFEVFNEEFQDTPVRVSESIGNCIERGKSSIADLVPHSDRYYKRLVGTYEGSKSVHEYIENVLKPHVTSLLAWNKSAGLAQALLLSTHPAIAPSLSTLGLDIEVFVDEIENLNKSGETLSVIGAIELGFKLLSIHPKFEGAVISLIEKLRDEKTEDELAGIPLFAALVMLVDGELSRVKLFHSAPPFYRRLAAFSHAALIHKRALASKIDAGHFIQWVYENWGLHYYVQASVDMRREPRWTPDYLAPAQIKADILGRVLISASANREAVEETQIYKMVVGDEEGTIQSICNFPKSYLPGPLEGGDPPALDIPEDLNGAIEENLRSGELVPPKLYALLNASLVFKVDIACAEEVAKIIKDRRYHINNVESKEQLFSLLAGFARLSAVTRCLCLADELRIMLRVYRHDEHFKLTVDDVLRITMEAAASRADILLWCEYVGNVFNDLAFGSLTESESASVSYYLSLISDAVPELWKYFSRADAALKSQEGVKRRH